VTIGGRPMPEFCFLPGRFRWTFLPKERCGDSLSGCGSNTQPFNWETDTLPLSYPRRFYRNFKLPSFGGSFCPILSSKPSYLLHVFCFCFGMFYVPRKGVSQEVKTMVSLHFITKLKKVGLGKSPIHNNLHDANRNLWAESQMLPLKKTHLYKLNRFQTL